MSGSCPARLQHHSAHKCSRTRGIRAAYQDTIPLAQGEHSPWPRHGHGTATGTIPITMNQEHTHTIHEEVSPRQRRQATKQAAKYPPNLSTSQQKAQQAAKQAASQAAPRTPELVCTNYFNTHGQHCARRT